MLQKYRTPMSQCKSVDVGYVRLGRFLLEEVDYRRQRLVGVRTVREALEKNSFYRSSRFAVIIESVCAREQGENILEVLRR